MNIEHRTLNVQHRIMYSACREPRGRTINLIKTGQSKSILRNSISLPFDRLRHRARRGELFGPEVITEGLVAGCSSLILKSIKRSVINIQRSMLDVRCSTFNLFTVPARRNLIRSFTRATLCGGSHHIGWVTPRIDGLP